MKLPTGYQDSQLSVQTYGNSSSAVVPLSEFFPADLYEEEKCIDSYDQSPMGISRSQISDFQYALSSKGGKTLLPAFKMSSSTSEVEI